MNLFNVENKVILITGGCVLGGQMSEYLLGNGATVVILDYKNEIVDVAVENLKKISNKVAGLVCNVMEEESLQKVSDTIVQQLERIDVLINAARGNMPGATIGKDQTIFDVNIDHFKKVVDLNLFGILKMKMEKFNRD